MKIQNPIVKFILAFLFAFGIMIMPWPGLEETYARFYQAQGKWASGILGSKAIIQFYKGNEQFDTQINLANRNMMTPDGKVTSVFFKVSSRSLGYLPLCLLIALILATPIRWKRRIWALFWGLLFMNGIICLKILLIILQKFNQTERFDLFILSPFWEQKLDYLVYLLVESPETSLILALVIWIIVSFRKDDISKFGHFDIDKPTKKPIRKLVQNKSSY